MNISYLYGRTDYANEYNFIRQLYESRITSCELRVSDAYDDGFSRGVECRGILSAPFCLFLLEDGKNIK